jgi:hypothetical protein
MEEKEVKKVVKRPKAKKSPKVDLSEKFIDIIQLIEKTVKEERGRSLNTSSCARLNRAKADLKVIVRNLQQ